MDFKRFIKCLEDKGLTTRIRIEDLREIVDNQHPGVGKVQFRYFPDFPNAELGTFMWLEEERSSAYEDPYNDAIVFINDRFREDREWTRMVSAKELMHVFDAVEQRTNDAEKYRKLLDQIESMPVYEDATAQYTADRVALWKGTIALIPPWIRAELSPGWKAGELKAAEISAKLWVPEAIITMAMGDYYEVAANRYLGS